MAPHTLLAEILIPLHFSGNSAIQSLITSNNYALLLGDEEIRRKNLLFCYFNQQKCNRKLNVFLMLALCIETAIYIGIAHDFAPIG